MIGIVFFSIKGLFLQRAHDFHRDLEEVRIQFCTITINTILDPFTSRTNHNLSGYKDNVVLNYCKCYEHMLYCKYVGLNNI